MADLTLNHPARPTAGRRFGYVVAAAVNLAMLWIAGNLLGWGWPAFLTDAFEDLLPFVAASLLVSAAVNLVWVVHDPPWLKHVGQIVMNLVSLVVAVETWRIFPFDFTGDASFWEPLFRLVLGVSIVAIGAATLVELVRLVVGGDDTSRPTAVPGDRQRIAT